jgi:hypothetical protein
MTDKQLRILQHTLGLDEYGRGSMYRNYYATGPESDPDCEALAEMGFMKQHPAQLFDGLYFSVTDKGKEAVRELSPTPPKLTRSQKRYLRWANADCGLSFGQWLKGNYERD